MKYSSIIVLFVLLAACSAGSPQESTSSNIGSPDQVATDTPVDFEQLPEVNGAFVQYGPHINYLSLPKGNGPFPAVVLIHEWWGLNENMLWYADKFAEQGYIALAVDLYDGQSTEDPAKAREFADKVRENPEQAMQTLQDAMTYLRTQPKVKPESLATVGWCFGGGWSYEIAKNNLGANASVIYYGQFNPEDDLQMMSTDIMGHFGEDDQVIPVEDVKAFRAKLQTLNGEHEIFIYENEGHGFAQDLETESAKQAWDRTLEFLSSQL